VPTSYSELTSDEEEDEELIAAMNKMESQRGIHISIFCRHLLANFDASKQKTKIRC